MRVLLIATNQHDRLMSRMNAQPLPIGLAYLAGALAASPHVVKTLDLMFSEDPLGDVEQAVREFQPALVGLSIRNLSNQSYLNPQWALPFSKAVIDIGRPTSFISRLPRPAASWRLWREEAAGELRAGTVWARGVAGERAAGQRARCAEAPENQRRTT